MPPRRVHWLDHVVSRLTRRERLFESGWGDEAALERMLASPRFSDATKPATIEWGPSWREGVIEITHGEFVSPFPELPREVSQVIVRRIAPVAIGDRQRRPVFVVAPSSGDEGFASRTRLFGPLAAQEGFEIVLLESAMYGRRRPPGQRGSSIRTVAEHLSMNLATVDEMRSLVEYFANEGRTRIGVTGFSMGGSMAALAAAAVRRPLAVAIFAAGRSAVPVFTEGLLAHRIEFEPLGGYEHARSRLRELFGLADLDRHPPPHSPDATILVGARRDGYVFTEQIEELQAHWRPSELRWLDTGHAGAFTYGAKRLRRAAVDAMTRLS